MRTPKKKRYKWRYDWDERPKKAVCYDCGLNYSTDFPDFTLPTYIWEMINPTYKKGCGILCPTCIIYRLDHIGLVDKLNELSIYQIFCGNSREYY